ncbi:ABC transporter transmembrane domain-containing protein [Paenibacillus alkalitolerans]|uniref:ABC transporter transmembrane domain-containing protein n=1 Tax=Paenibacillus alkalitolerans TaxID=2799335 RepID=UPI0018F64152|nr:ABC transporter ATP-binding protein [Paenibacillus alkalitolerans]
MQAKYTLSGLLRDQTFRKLFQIIRKYKWIYVWLIGSQVALTGITLVFAETNRRLFDLAPNIPMKVLTVLLGVYVTLVVVRTAITFFQNWSTSFLNESVVYAMRRDLLNHLRDLPLGFHEKEHSSNSAHVVLNQLEITKDFVVFDMQKLLFLPISFLMAGVYLLTVHPLLGIVAICIGPMQLLSNVVLRKKFMKISELQQEVTRDVFHRIYETLHGIREVKANRMESFTDGLMGEIQKKGVEYNVILTKVSSIRNIFRELPGQVGYITGIVIGAYLMSRGTISVGGLVAFITLLERVVEPFTNLVNVITNLQRSISGGRRFFEVMEMRGEDFKTGMPLAS